LEKPERLAVEQQVGEAAEREQRAGTNDDSPDRFETQQLYGEKATARAITMNFITGGLGSAIFSLPWSLAGASIIPSVIIVGLVLMVNAWTISIVIRVADRYNEFDLGGVISHLPHGLGPPLQVVTNVFVWASMFLCLVSYIIVIHDGAATLFEGHWIAKSRFLLVALASLCVLPLCFFSQRLLERTSSGAIAVNIYIFTLIGVLYGETVADNKLPAGCCVLGLTVKGSFAMVTVMFQAVIVQMCVLPMYQELEDRSPRKFDKIVAVGFGTLFFMFCGFATIGYLLIGPTVDSNILNDLPRNAASNVARVGTMCVMGCVYPIMVYPMIAPIHGPLFGVPRDQVVTVAKFVIVLAAMCIAYITADLGEVNVINGAMSVGIFVALIPSVLGLVLLETSTPYKVALVVLLLAGMGLCAAGFIFSKNYVEELQCSIHA